MGALRRNPHGVSENQGVGSSILPWATNVFKHLQDSLKSPMRPWKQGGSNKVALVGAAGLSSKAAEQRIDLPVSEFPQGDSQRVVSAARAVRRPEQHHTEASNGVANRSTSAGVSAGAYT